MGAETGHAACDTAQPNCCHEAPVWCAAPWHRTEPGPPPRQAQRGWDPPLTPPPPAPSASCRWSALPSCRRRRSASPATAAQHREVRAPRTSAGSEREDARGTRRPSKSGRCGRGACASRLPRSPQPHAALLACCQKEALLSSTNSIPTCAARHSAQHHPTTQPAACLLPEGRDLLQHKQQAADGGGEGHRHAHGRPCRHKVALVLGVLCNGKEWIAQRV